MTSTVGVIGDSNAPDKDAEEFYKKPKSDNVGWGRILSYYRPWYYTLAISLISIISVWGFLLVGGFVVTTIILFMTYEMGTRGLAGSFQVSGIEQEAPEEPMSLEEFKTYKMYVLLVWLGWSVLMTIAGGS
jgi:hypothetical protein